jgi:hypothetical protein
MKMLRLLLLLLVFFLGCEQDDPGSHSNAEQFLNEVLNIMEANSIHRNTIDWVDFKKKVFAKVEGAKSIVDTYPGLEEALKMLGDSHSFFIKPNGGRISYSLIQCYAPLFLEPALPDDIGYVKVDQFTGSTGADGVAFAQEIQNQIKSEDKANLIGWIVDLRGNTGGNMWPMLAGIGPLLGEGVVGYFIDPEDNEESWSFHNGAAEIGGATAVKVLNSYQMITSNPKVAVLLDNAVGSSGEAIAISFIGRQKTRSFGSSTCGLSTANQAFSLSDGHSLYLTVSFMADRNKNKFGIPITPDQISTNQTLIEDAVQWIQN